MNKRRNVYHRKDEGSNIKTGLLSPIIYYPTDEELKKEKERINQLSKDMEKFLSTPLDYFMFECWWSGQKDYYLSYECAIYAYCKTKRVDKMNWNTCCYKALKHGETVCPVCNQTLLPIGIPQQLAIKFRENQK